MRDLTRCVHQPAVSRQGFASLAVPTERASTIVFDDAAAYAQRRQHFPDGYSYGLHGTPTTHTLEAQLTALHEGVRTVLVPSGLAAATTVLLATLLPGDKVLIPDTVYPPIRDFCGSYLRPRGIDFAAYDPLIGAGIAALVDQRTRLVWIESPGSTTMEVQDVPAIVAAAHSKGALVGCDNTWATPLLFKPLAHGADFAMEALTKYAGGHSDLLLGSVTVADLALHRRLKDCMRLLGIGVSPDDCSLVLRGLQTMGVRLAHVGRVAAEFAGRLVGAAGVVRVLHPALPTCPGHDLWRRDFKGASGVFSVVLRPDVEPLLEPALAALRLFRIGASWGGTHSLVVPMSVKAERTVNPWAEDGAILRFSIGLEDPDDLWADLAALFGTLAGRARDAV